MRGLNIFLSVICMGIVGMMIGAFLGIPEGMGIIFAIGIAAQYIVNEIRNIK